MLFTKIEGACVVLRRKGVFYEVPVYEKLGQLFAGYGKGFIYLRANTSTSVSDVSWRDLMGVEHSTGVLGYLFQVNPKGKKRAA
jgi:hypothetical protein